MRQAYHADSALEAQAQLEALATELDKTHPGAAGSLREGLAETLTVLRLGVPPTLARTLRSHQRGRVDDLDLPRPLPQRQTLARRADGAALVRRRHGRGAKQFRRVNGHLHLPALRAALERHVAAETVRTDCNTQDVSAA